MNSAHAGRTTRLAASSVVDRPGARSTPDEPDISRNPNQANSDLKSQFNTVRSMTAFHVSVFEADAFAKPRSCRLLTEAEWESVASSLPVEGTILGADRLHPGPANGIGDTEQLFGDCWEWTASAYTGYPGYKPPVGALGEYNAKFMSSQMILRGGSCVTPADHLRATYCNFFPLVTRWQFSGIRLAK